MIRCATSDHGGKWGIGFKLFGKRRAFGPFRNPFWRWDAKRFGPKPN